MELLKAQFGRKHPPSTPAVLEKIKKACKCHLTKALAFHEDACPLNPVRLKGALQRHELNRASIKLQLQRRTSFPASYVKAAFLRLFGPASSLAGLFRRHT